MAQPQQIPAITAVRRKAALLAVASVLLAAFGLEAYARGFPMGMSLFAAASVQAVLCCAMYGSPLLRALAALDFALFLFQALVVREQLGHDGASPLFGIADFGSAVLATASMVFAPVETVALIVREAYLQRPKPPQPPPPREPPKREPPES